MSICLIVAHSVKSVKNTTTISSRRVKSRVWRSCHILAEITQPPVAPPPAFQCARTQPRACELRSAANSRHDIRPASLCKRRCGNSCFDFFFFSFNNADLSFAFPNKGTRNTVPTTKTKARRQAQNLERWPPNQRSMASTIRRASIRT